MDQINDSIDELNCVTLFYLVDDVDGWQLIGINETLVMTGGKEIGYFSQKKSSKRIIIKRERALMFKLSHNDFRMIIVQCPLP